MKRFTAPEPGQNILVTSFSQRLNRIDGLEPAQRTAMSATAEKLVRESVYPAYRRAMDGLQTVNVKSGNDAGLWRLPKGDAAYAFYLRRFTTTNMTASQIHQKGREEVTRIEAEMETLFRKLGYIDGSNMDKFRKLQADNVYPNTPDVREKVLADELDMIIVPDAFADTRIPTKAIGRVESAWMCKPGLLSTRRIMKLRELAAHTILAQGGKSGTGIIYDRWFKSQAVAPSNAISCNSLVALIGLTVSGLGVSYLPRRCLDGMIERGLLDVVRTVPALPDVTYVAMYRGGQRSRLVSSIIRLAQATCDFSRMFQTEPDP